MKKRLLIGGIITVLVVGIGMASYFAIANIINKENAKLVIQLNKQKADEKKAYDKRVADEKALADEKAIEDAKAQAILDAQAKADADALAKADADALAKADAQAIEDAKIVVEKNVYIRMHGMINTKIKATDGQVWGEIPITTLGCDELIEILNNNNYADKKTLLTFLNGWKKKDFSNGVAQHNYIWEKLGGVEGKAYSLK